jgi:AraC-like DNA-binding protein
MAKKEKIKVYKMDDWFSGVYIKPFGAKNTSVPDYEISRPHRHDFYYCILLEKGRLELEVDFEKVELTDQTLFLSYPGQIHRIISNTMEKGWFLAFNPAILDERLKNILDQFLSQIVLVVLPIEKSKNISLFIAQLFDIYNNETEMFRNTITRAMVTALAYQLASAYLSVEQINLIKHSARSIEITKNFKQILRYNFKSIKKPSEYAAKMNVTVSYLNDTVKSVTGFSVTYYIQNELMREGQRLLYYSELSVKEIANTLGFEDDKYFNRLFSKVIGISPGAFRKQNEVSFHIQS